MRSRKRPSTVTSAAILSADPQEILKKATIVAMKKARLKTARPQGKKEHATLRKHILSDIFVRNVEVLLYRTIRPVSSVEKEYDKNEDQKNTRSSDPR